MPDTTDIKKKIAEIDEELASLHESAGRQTGRMDIIILVQAIAPLYMAKDTLQDFNEALLAGVNKLLT